MIDRKRNRMHVKPAKGILIRKCHEAARAAKRGKPPAFLAVTGEWVPRTIEWSRAVKCGDVVLCKPPKSPATPTPTKPAAGKQAN